MKHFHFRWTRVAVFVIGILSQTPNSATREKPIQPLWQADLSAAGYESYSLKHGDISIWAHKRGVVFTSPSVLAAYFIVHTQGALSARGEPQPSAPYHLKAVFLNTKVGDILARGDWPLRPSNPSYFFATQEGRFIVGTGGILSLYSPDLVLLREQKLPWADWIPARIWTVQVDPSGETLLVQWQIACQSPSDTMLDLIDAAHLSILDSWSEPISRLWTLWRDDVTWTNDRDVYMKALRTEPKVLMHSDQLFCGGPSFVNQDTLVVGISDGGRCAAAVVLSTNGAPIREIRFGSEHLGGPIVASRNGRFFAVRTMIPGLFDRPTPRKVTIRVFGVASEKPLLSVNMPPDLDWGSLALSPDGDLLAVGVGSMVQVYRVPQHSDFPAD